jgi:DoxX-like family
MCDNGAMKHDDRGSPSSREIWAGRILSGLAILAMSMDAAGKLLVPEVMIANSPPLGLPADPAFHRMLGVILAVCTALYAWPRTAVLGAILLTGYLGGAVSAHLRVGSPLASFTLVGVYIGVVIWGGLWLRDPRVRTLFV